MTPEAKQAMAEFDFELAGPSEPTPGLISVRLGLIMQRMEPALREPAKAPIALKQAFTMLQKLVAAIDAYEVAKADAEGAQPPREDTKQYEFKLAGRIPGASIEAQLDTIERLARDSEPPQEETMRYQIVKNGEDPALLVTPKPRRR